MLLITLIGTLLLASASGTVAAQQPRDPLGVGPGPLPPTVRVPPTPNREAIERALRKGDWDQAEKLLAAEIDQRPESPELLKFLAGIFLMDRKPLNAAIAIKKAEQFGALDEATRHALALAYIAMGRRDWARPELERLEAASPADSTYQYWLARLDYDEGLYGRAIGRLERVIAKEPDFMRAHDNLGLCYEAQGDTGRAVAHYRKAIALNRQAAARSPWPPLNLGILLRSRGEMTESERLLREAVQYDEALPQARYELGVLLEQTDHPDDAVEELSRAAALDPGYPQPHYALARIHRRQGRTADAQAALATFKRLQEKQAQQPEAVP